MSGRDNAAILNIESDGELGRVKKCSTNSHEVALHCEHAPSLFVAVSGVKMSRQTTLQGRPGFLGIRYTGAF